MVYVIGITVKDVPVMIRGHRNENDAIRTGLVALARAKNLTAHGVFIHEAEGRKEAEDLARIRIWAEKQSSDPPWIEAPILEELEAYKQTLKPKF